MLYAYILNIICVIGIVKSINKSNTAKQCLQAKDLLKAGGEDDPAKAHKG